MLLVGLVAVAFGWLIVAVALIGWGSIFWKSRALEADSIISCLELFWVGFVAALGFVQVWHFFLPVDWRVSAVILTVGVFGCWRRAKSSWNASGMPRRFWLFFLPIAIWALLSSRAVPTAYDSGLYHFNSIRWLNECAIVPGLGNLHMRLGFNQNYFLFPALLNVFPFFGHGHNLANGLLMLAVAARFSISAASLLSGARPLSPAELFRAFSLPVIWWFAKSSTLSSPSPDYPLFLIGILIASELIEILSGGLKGEALNQKLVFLTVLIFGASVFKITIIPFCGVTLIIALWKAPMKLRFLAAGICLMLCGPWMIRGVITSGYPLFPSSIARTSFDWAMPEEETRHLRRLLYGFARRPVANIDETLSNWNWLGPWLRRDGRDAAVSTPTIITLGLIMLGFLRGPRGWVKGRNWLPFAPAATWILYWFFTAPDVRYVGPAFWIVALWALSLAAPTMLIPWKGDRVVPVIFMALLVGALCQVIGPVRRGFADGGKMFVPIPTRSMVEFRTDSGLTVFVPATPDQNWDHKNPSTPYPNPKLEARGPDLCAGFRVR